MPIARENWQEGLSEWLSLHGAAVRSMGKMAMHVGNDDVTRKIGWWCGKNVDSAG